MSVPHGPDATGPREVAGPRSRRRRGGRGCLFLLLVPLLLLGALILLRAPLLRAVARAVEVHEAPLRADFIYLLNGDSKWQARADHAAALWRAGYAPRVVIARAEDYPGVRRGDYPNDTEVNVRNLLRHGVPAEAVTVLRTPGGVTSTGDEAAALARYLRDHPADTVLVVTTEFHTRRARWLLRRAVAPARTHLRIVGARHPRFHADNWWRVEEGVIAYFSEYLKWGHNLLVR